MCFLRIMVEAMMVEANLVDSGILHFGRRHTFAAESKSHHITKKPIVLPKGMILYLCFEKATISVVNHACEMTNGIHLASFE